MSWIGEHIWDLVTRFRNFIFVENGYGMKFIDTADDAEGSKITFDKTRGSSPNQVNDMLGKLNFTSGNIPVCNIQAHVDSVTSGSKTGSFKFFVKAKGADDSSPMQAMKLYGNTSVTNQVDVELGNAGWPGEITLNGRVVGSNTFGTDANSIQSVIGDVTLSSTLTNNPPVWTIQTNPTGDGDTGGIGTIKFRAKNDTPSLLDMANIYTSVTDVSAGSENASMLLQVMGSGNMLSVANWNYLLSEYMSVQHVFNGKFTIKGLGSGQPYEPILQLHNKDTTISAWQNLGQIDFMNDDDDGTTLQIKGIATEDHVSGSNGGSKLEFYVTPDTTSSLAKAVTIGQDKSLTVEGDIVVNGNDIIFEGTSADANELTLSGGNPGSDITVTLPASTGTLALTSDDITGNAATATTAVSLTSGNKTIDGNLTIGSNDDTTAHVIEREQVTGTNAGPDLRLKAGTASGDSQNGGDLCLYAGKATGNGSGGEIKFYSSNANAPALDTVQEDAIVGRFYNNGGFRIEGDLTVVGNDIKDNDGTTCITFDSSGNTTIAGTTTGTFSGNLTGNASGLSSTLAVGSGGTGATTFTSNAILTGNGSSAIQAEARLTYDSETLTIGEDDNGAATIERKTHSDDSGGALRMKGGTATGTDKGGGSCNLYGGQGTGTGNGGSINFYVYKPAGSTGSSNNSTPTSVIFSGEDASFQVPADLLGPRQDNMSIKSDGCMVFEIDKDDDESSQYFSWMNNSDTELARLDESGHLRLNSGRLRESARTRIKILPSDFIPDDGGRPAMIDDTGSDRWLESHGTSKLYVSIDIPTEYKATHVNIHGSATSAVTVYEADINSKTVTSKGTGNIGTEINITDVTSDTTNYLLIELDQASGEEVYGGYVTIALT